VGGDPWSRNPCSGLELSAADVGCLETFGAFQQVELDGLALVQSAVTVFLDSGKMNEHIFTCGPLDKTVSFCPVEPLYCTLLSHKSTPFASYRFARALREACASKSPLKEPVQVFPAMSPIRTTLPQKAKTLRLRKTYISADPERDEMTRLDDVTENICRILLAALKVGQQEFI
jgi:hypothetical protein